MNKDIIIQFVNVHKNYQVNNQNINIFDNLNFELPNAEMIAVIGPSGSGKTTLLNLISMLDADYKGEIYIKQTNIKQYSKEQKIRFRAHNIGFMFQNFNLLADLTVLENIILPLQLQNYSLKDAKQKAVELLNDINLLNQQHKFPSMLSGGQQQRVSIARAIIHRPSLIIADEPTGNLDRHNAIIIFDLIKQLSIKYQITVLIATHDELIFNQISNQLVITDNNIQFNKGDV